MKKIIALLLMAMLLLGAAVGCTPAAPADAKIAKIVVGLDDQFAPMGFRLDDGTLTGFDVDMATAVAEQLGCEIEFKPIDWDAKVLELNSGSIDCIWNGLSISEERKQEMDFTDPYLANNQVIIVPVGSAITGIADLAGKNVGFQKGSSAVDAYDANAISGQEASRNEYPDNVTALTDMSIGRVDAVVMDEIVARYYATLSEGEYTVLTESFAAEEYGVGIKKGNTALLTAIQTGFDAIVANGKAAEISNKWFGEDIVLK